MKQLIQDLIDQVLSLPTPVSLPEAAMLFNKPGFFEASNQISDENSPAWLLLTSLNNNLLEWQTLQMEWKKASDSQKTIKDLISRREQTQDGIEKNNALIAKYEAASNALYHLVHKTYTEEVLVRDPTLAVLSPGDTSSKLLLVKDYVASKRSRLSELQLENLQVSLAEKSSQRKQLIDELCSSGITIASADPDKLAQIVEKLLLQEADLSKFNQQFSELLSQISAEISIPELAKNISDLEEQIEQQSKLLEAIDLKLANSTINSLLKTTLQDEYSQSENKEDFLSKKMDAVNWEASRYNFSAWNRWLRDPAYSKDMSQQQQEVDFLQHWHMRIYTNQILQGLSEKLIQTKQIIPSKANALSAEHESLLLRERAMSVIKAHNSPYLEGDESNLSLLNHIIKQISLIQQKIDGNRSNVQLLQKLIQVDESILSLRTQNSIIFDTAALLTQNQPNESLIKAAVARQAEITKLESLIDTCEGCINNLEGITALNAEISAGKQSLKRIASTIKKQPKLTQNDQYYEQAINNLKRVVEDEIRQLTGFASKRPEVATAFVEPIVTLENNEKAIPSEFERSHPLHSPDLSFTPSELMPILEEERILDQNSIEFWDDKIRQLLHQLPQELSSWYIQLYQALASNLLDRATTFQACQLLRDIHFEIQNPPSSNPFEVLEHYRQKALNPSTDWQQLTGIKPALSLKFNAKKAALPTSIEQLYEKHNQLMDKHSREAELLLQATNNLHQILLLAQKSATNPVLANVHNNMADPRYECLRQHRGFLQVCEWLAKLCTSILELFKTQQENSYRQRFFFVPTRTSKLLDAGVNEAISCGG